MSRSGGAAWAAVALAAIALAVLSLRLGLNGDVQYVLGGLQVGPDGFVNTFVHRPLADRAVMAAMDSVSRVIATPFDDLARYEATMRVIAMLAAAAAGALLALALSSRVGGLRSSAIGLAVGITLALPPAWDMLQPEWHATLFAVLGVAAAIGPRRRVLAAVLAGASLTVVIGLKLATGPMALVALLAIWRWDHARARDAAAATAVVSVVALVAIYFFFPLEWQWLQDMVALNPNRLGRTGFDTQDMEFTLRSLGSKMALQPILVLVPAAVVITAKACPRGKARWRLGLGTSLALALAISPAVLQGQYYLYHVAMLPVLGAALVAIAATERVAAYDLPLLALIAALTIGASVALGADVDGRRAAADWVSVTLVVVAALLAVASAMRRSADGHRPVRLGIVATGLLIASLPALLPTSAWALDPEATPWTNNRWAERSAVKHEQLAAVRSEIGVESTVLYLAYGDVAYHLGIRSACRYPSPLFVQRGSALSYVTGFTSYADNLICLSLDEPEFAIVQPGWLGYDTLLPDVRRAIDERYDCRAPLIAGDTIVCPRRQTP